MAYYNNGNGSEEESHGVRVAIWTQAACSLINLSLVNWIDVFTFLKCFIGDILSVVSVKELTIIISYKTEQYNTERVSFDCFVGGVGVVNLN